jgi:Domain of unknown function (DUF4331)
VLFYHGARCGRKKVSLHRATKIFLSPTSPSDRGELRCRPRAQEAIHIIPPIVEMTENGESNVEDRDREWFTTEIRPPFNDLPVAYAGVDPVPGLPPAITALDGAGSEGLGLRQHYSVRVVNAQGQVLFQTSTDADGTPLIAVPSNIGIRTMPTYDALAAQGIYDLGRGMRVFAGQRKETFYIDLGSTFDTLNFRRNPPVLTNGEDADNTVNPFGLNDFQGLNINTIALEIPVASLPSLVGLYALTSRQRVEVRKPNGTAVGAGHFMQVARLANPLVNELIIGTGFKDRWNATDPKDEAQFLDFYQTPRLAAVLNLAYGIPIPETPRNDSVAVLLKYAGQDPSTCASTNPCAELMRLDLSVPPTAAADQKRLTGLAHDADGNPTPDPAGWPNGRRPNDDVTDIAIRVVAGVLVPGPTAGFPHNRLGDGVNFNEVLGGTADVTPNGISTVFPFLNTAGRRGTWPMPCTRAMPSRRPPSRRPRRLRWTPAIAMPTASSGMRTWRWASTRKLSTPMSG